jgi:regulatory protein
MRECEIDWAVLAREQAIRKYGEPLPVDFSDKVKVQRFALSRLSDGRYSGNMAKF